MGSGEGPSERRIQANDFLVLEANDIFNDHRQVLYAWLHTLEVQVSTIDTYAKMSGGRIVAVAEAFGELGAQINNSATDNEDAQDFIATIWRNDDIERMIMFKGLTGCLCYDVESNPQEDDSEEDDDPTEDIVLSNIKIAYDEAENGGNTLAGAIEDAYQAVAIKEIGALLGHLAYGSSEFHERDLEASQSRVLVSKNELSEKIISFSLDVAKIAIGAGIALWANKRLQGRA